MTNPFYTEHKERKVPTGKKSKLSPTPGAAITRSRMAMVEGTANWPTPGPMRSTGFNRKTNWPVAKVRPKKAGID